MQRHRETGSLWNGLKGQDVRCFSALAFTIGTPQSAPTDAQYEDLATKVFGGSPTLGQVSGLRRLHFEATTLIVATLNEQVKSDTADPSALVKKLPAAEKQARLEKQQARLTGIKMVGELAPSHQLLDLASSILESGAIVWIAPSRCSKRDDEIHANIKPSSSTVQVENSTLKLAQVPISTTADLGRELKLMWAFQRRGLAMDNCRLLDWSTHETWLWTILAQENSTSLRPVNDVPALNVPFKALVTDPRVTMFLLPVPSSLNKGATVPQQVTPKHTGDAPKPAPNNNANKKRKLTRAQKGCPAELKEFNLRLAQGSTSGPICWDTTSKRGVRMKLHTRLGVKDANVDFMLAQTATSLDIAWFHAEL